MNSWIQLLTLIGLIISIITFFLDHVLNKGKLIKLLKDLFFKVIHFNSNRKRMKFYQIVSDKEFIRWENDLLMKIYGENNFTQLAGKIYPAKCIPASKEVSKLNNLCSGGLTTTEKDKQTKLNKFEKEYWRIVRPAIHSKDKVGYAVDELELNNEGEITKIKARPCTYKQNVILCHILEYELYKLFISDDKDEAKNTADVSKLLSFLPQRHTIHLGEPINSLIYKGKTRIAEFGVQALFVFKDSVDGDHQYRIRFMQRSKATAIRKDFYQFIPSGGFEIFDESPKRETIIMDFRVDKAVFIELLEEVYNKRELERKSDKTSEELIFHDPYITKLKELLQKNEADFYFLGSVFDFIVMRHELSFLIVVDDNELSQKIADSGEGKAHNYSIKQVVERLANEEYKINPGSAGLWKLATEAEVFNSKVLKHL